MSSVQPSPSFFSYMKPWSSEFHLFKKFQTITSRVEKAKIIILTSLATIFSLGIFTAYTFRKLTEGSLVSTTGKTHGVGLGQLDISRKKGDDTVRSTEMWVEKNVVNPLIRIIVDLPNRQIIRFGEEKSLNKIMLDCIYEMEFMCFGSAGINSFGREEINNFIDQMVSIGRDETPKEIKDKVEEIRTLATSSKLEEMDKERDFSKIVYKLKQSEDFLRDVYINIFGFITPSLPNRTALIETIFENRLKDIEALQKIKKANESGIEEQVKAKIQNSARLLKELIRVNQITCSGGFIEKLNKLLDITV